MTGEPLPADGRLLDEFAESPDRTTFVGVQGGELTLYDAATNDRRGVLRKSSGERWGNGRFSSDMVQYSLDGRYLAAVTPAGHAVQVWSASGAPVATLTGHSGGLETLAWGARETRHLLVTAGAADSTVRLWDIDRFARR